MKPDRRLPHDTESRAAKVAVEETPLEAGIRRRQEAKDAANWRRNRRREVLNEVNAELTRAR